VDCDIAADADGSVLVTLSELVLGRSEIRGVMVRPSASVGFEAAESDEVIEGDEVDFFVSA
jgi:hypothetical protein